MKTIFLFQLDQAMYILSEVDRLVSMRSGARYWFGKGDMDVLISTKGPWVSGIEDLWSHGSISESNLLDSTQYILSWWEYPLSYIHPLLITCASPSPFDAFRGLYFVHFKDHLVNSVMACRDGTKKPRKYWVLHEVTLASKIQLWVATTRMLWFTVVAIYRTVFLVLPAFLRLIIVRFQLHTVLSFDDGLRRSLHWLLLCSWFPAADLWSFVGIEEFLELALHALSPYGVFF